MYFSRVVSVQCLLNQHTEKNNSMESVLTQGAVSSCAAARVWVKHSTNTTALHLLWAGRWAFLPLPPPPNYLIKGMYKSCGRDNKYWGSCSRCWALKYHLGMSNSSQNSLLRNCSEGWDGSYSKQAGRKESRSSGSSLEIVIEAREVVAMLLITWKH